MRVTKATLGAANTYPLAAMANTGIVDCSQRLIDSDRKIGSQILGTIVDAIRILDFEAMHVNTWMNIGSCYIHLYIRDICC